VDLADLLVQAGAPGVSAAGLIGTCVGTGTMTFLLALGLTRQESETTGTHVRADAVEMAYFSYGRDLARKRRANAAH